MNLRPPLNCAEKPRIKWHRVGVWVCQSTEPDGDLAVGAGETPRLAYFDWELDLIERMLPT